MTYQLTKRNRYYDPAHDYEYTSSEQHFYQDFEDFHLPLARLHHANLHGFGVVHGLDVSGAIGGAEIAVHAGVAVDHNGQMIILSEVGKGDVGLDPPGNQHSENLVPVPIGTAGHAGQTVYVTIQFSEILRRMEGSGGRWEQVPWIRLQPVSEVDAEYGPGEEKRTEFIILAIADIGQDGALRSLSHVAGCHLHRRMLSEQAVEELWLQRSGVGADGTVQAMLPSKLLAGEASSLRIETTQLDLAGNLAVTGTAKVQGDFEASGVLKSTAEALTLRDPTTLLSTLTVDGNVGIGKSGAPATLTVSGPTNLNDTLHVAKAVTLDQGLTVGSNVGIGATDPKNRLDIEGAAVIGATYAGSNTAPSNGLLVEGNVGIGTTVPKNRLDIEGAAVIGATYAGTNTAPSNGLLVEGNVGIGTTVPKNKLDVKGSAVVGATYAGSNIAPANSLLIEGMVGIGHSSPTKTLDVAGQGLFRSATWTGSAAGVAGATIGFDPANAGGTGFIYAHTATRQSTRLWFDGNPIIFAPAATERVRIDSAGNVGIGTPTPNAKLEVVGDLKVTGKVTTTNSAGIGIPDPKAKLHIVHTPQDANGNTLILGPTDGANLRLGYHTDYSWIQSHGSKPLSINPISNNVGIGTTNPQAKLQVSGGAIMPSIGNGETAGIMFPKNPGGGAGDAAWIRYYSRGGESTMFEIGTSNDADDHISLMPSGSVTIGTTKPQDLGYKLYVEGASALGGPDYYSHFPSKNNYAYVTGENIIFRNGKSKNWAERMVITGDGNVGIGTTSPTVKLEVAGELKVTGSRIRNAQGYGIVETNGTDWLRINPDSQYPAIAIYKPMAVGTGGLSVGEWLQLPQGQLKTTSSAYLATASGNVGIGTTNPQAKLDVNGRLTRKGDEFSKKGVKNHGEMVDTPWGTLEDWNIFVSPYRVGHEEIGSEGDNALLMFECYAIPYGSSQFQINCRYKYRYANSPSGTWYDGTANYVLIPR